MNVLFLTLLDFDSLNESNIYTDLLREFVNKGHSVYVVSPVERRKKQKTHVVKDGDATILRLKIGNTQKTNFIEKGISTVMIEPQFKYGIRKYFSDIKFDLVLFSTPPITFTGAVKYVKNRDKAKTYLLLKDIFPQNAVDIGVMSTKGLNGLLYKQFRKKEKQLYEISDWIGCMSPANVDYLIKNNPEINPAIVEVNPNCIEIVDKSIDTVTRETIRKKYNIPLDKTVFVYGGNLGKPQGIPFIIDCLKNIKNEKDVFFLIIGDGTEYSKLEHYVNHCQQMNIKLMQRLPKEDYDLLVSACDVGLIFLDHRFTIPNFPSRLLSYMQARIPVLACTDPNTDLGKVIEEAGFGWWCESNNPEHFASRINMIKTMDRKQFGNKAFDYLKGNYTVEKGYSMIIEKTQISD